MSRDSRDDARDDRALEVDPRGNAESDHQRLDDDLFARQLNLADGGVREVIVDRDRTYLLDQYETRALATIGAFRVVSAADLLEANADLRDADLRHLIDEGLVTRETVTDTAGSQHTLALTDAGKDLLDANRHPDVKGAPQTFYAGVVKPREVQHDMHLYQAFREEESRIHAEGGRVTRVVLDYELKRDYQRFLNRNDRSDDTSLEADRRAFAQANDLHVVDGHLELPDMRIEYETEDGRFEHRDVEIVTEHYSRGQISGKARAGFTCYRVAGGSTRAGGTPFDPRHLRRLS
jgi:hypothetical protein